VLLPRRRLVEQLPPECLVGLGAAYQPYCTQVRYRWLQRAVYCFCTVLQGPPPLPVTLDKSTLAPFINADHL
jgi:hypothetical protein